MDSDPKYRIHLLSSRFQSAEIEGKFRRHTLAEDKMRGILLIGISIAALWIVIWIDYRHQGFSPVFLKAAVPKMTLIVASAVIMFFAAGTKKVSRLDGLLLAFSLLFVLSKVYGGYLRAPDYTVGAVLDIEAIMAIYLVLPGRLDYRFASAMALTLFSHFPLANPLLFVPHLFAHTVGLVFAGMVSRNRREQYLLLIREARLKNELEKSEKEVLFISEKLAEQNKMLKNYADRDPLTGIYNRRTFSEYAEEQWSRAIRKDEDCSLLLLDLDHFKLINDTHGHTAGDTVLKGVADTIRKLIRPYDRFGRWGGEEFVVYLPETDIVQARNIAERIRLSVEGEQYQGIRVTISIGMSSRKISGTMDFDAMLNQADKALYEAKITGRNDICIYGSRENQG